MRLFELFEGRVKNAGMDGTYQASVPKRVGKFCISINGKKWGNFDTHNAAMKVAERKYAENPKLHISVVPR
jgi:hypothetical protein